MLATLLSGASRYEEAKSAVLGAIEKFPDKEIAFSEIGQRIVEATGDKTFRQRMDETVKAGRK